MSYLSIVEGSSCEINVVPIPKDRTFFSFHLNAHVKVKFHCRLNPLMSFTLHDFRQATETSLYYVEKYDVRIILAEWPVPALMTVITAAPPHTETQTGRREERRRIMVFL